MAATPTLTKRRLTKRRTTSRPGSGEKAGATITEADVHDAWAELLADTWPIVPTDGRTVPEMTAELGVGPGTMARRVKKLVAAGRLRKIGVRPDRPRTAVYEIIPEGGQ